MHERRRGLRAFGFTLGCSVSVGCSSGARVPTEDAPPSTSAPDAALGSASIASNAHSTVKSTSAVTTSGPTTSASAAHSSSASALPAAVGSSSAPQAPPLDAGAAATVAAEGGAPLADAAALQQRMLPSCEQPPWRAADFQNVYEVGPGLEYETPSDVPWEALDAGSLVRIHARATPYHDKWVVNASGTAEHPVVVLGVPEQGQLPAISGDGAMTRPTLDYWNEDRGIIKIGGSSDPAGPASHVVIACLEIEAGRTDSTFTAADGSEATYTENAACVYLEGGANVQVLNNVIHGCGNGIFASSGTSELRIAGNSIFDNGNVGSAYEHNTYTEARGITFEYNHYGPLCAGCDGNNLKDRSSGTVIRYNWIESGNRQLDLVESDHAELIDDSAYREAFVYGNVLVEPDAAGNNQIVHYGGDGADEDAYRKGTLYFYFNTVVSTRAGNTTLFRLSTEDESVLAFGNIFAVTAEGSALAVSAGAGQLRLDQNWLPAGWVDSHDVVTLVLEVEASVEGSAPGFAATSTQDFTLAANSPCIDQGAAISWDVVHDHVVAAQYFAPQNGEPRPSAGALDLGAFERP